MSDCWAVTIATIPERRDLCSVGQTATIAYPAANPPASPEPAAQLLPATHRRGMRMGMAKPFAMHVAVLTPNSYPLLVRKNSDKSQS